jgi:hypothetical protein
VQLYRYFVSQSGRGLGIFLFTTASRTALGPTHPPTQWVQGALSLVVKRPGYEAEHSPPSGAEVKEYVELYLHSSNTPSWCDAQSKRHRHNFTFIYIYIDFRRRLGIFLFTTASRPALWPTQPPIQSVPGALSLEVKRQGREADHSPPSGAEVIE